MDEFRSRIQDAQKEGNNLLGTYIQPSISIHSYSVQQVLLEQRDFFKSKGIRMGRQMFIMIGNGAIFATQFFAIKKMLAVSVVWCIHLFSQVGYPGLSTGGIAWFTDLTVSDPYFILPLISAGTMAIVMRVSQAIPNRWQNVFRSELKQERRWIHWDRACDSDISTVFLSSSSHAAPSLHQWVSICISTFPFRVSVSTGVRRMPSLFCMPSYFVFLLFGRYSTSQWWWRGRNNWEERRRQSRSWCRITKVGNHTITAHISSQTRRPRRNRWLKLETGICNNSRRQDEVNLCWRSEGNDRWICIVYRMILLKITVCCFIFDCCINSYCLPLWWLYFVSTCLSLSIRGYLNGCPSDRPNSLHVPPPSIVHTVSECSPFFRHVKNRWSRTSDQRNIAIEADEASAL